MPRALLVVFAVLLTALPRFGFGQVPSVQWKCTTQSSPWVDEPDVVIRSKDGPSTGQVIRVDLDQQFQTIDGWGGCFNERGWRAMQVLSSDQRAGVLQKLFSATDGLKLNICRTPIAASDYAIQLYSYDETPGDFEMAQFSIDRDRAMLLPYIKAALALRPDLKLWAVPWSPPSWMKDSGKLAGGHIKTDPKTMEALALYFIKYVQAYRGEGIPLYMVMPQNEPCYSTAYTSCEWTGAEIGNFVRDYLGPAFKQANLDCQIYLGTFPRSDAKKYDYDYWLGTSLSDPLTRLYVTGIGCQWDGDGVMRDVRKKHPELKLMQTEAECGDKNTNDWAFASKRFEQIVNYIDSGAQSFMIWNLVLDETGLSTAKWAQCSPIVVNQQSRQVIYTPYFYAFEHFSSFVKPGARRVGVSGGKVPCEAFINPDGQVILQVENSADTAQPVDCILGNIHFAATLPAKSFSTFVRNR